MTEQKDQHNPASYADLIILSADSTEKELQSQTKDEPKRLIPGMFSSISDAELITQRLIAQAESNDSNT